jgi:hypothetical protein
MQAPLSSQPVALQDAVPHSLAQHLPSPALSAPQVSPCLQGWMLSH